MLSDTKYFTVKEMTYLPQWKRQASSSELTLAICRNLQRLFETMDKVRELLGKPVIVHVAYRPEAYNKLVGGAKVSAHITGEACDFSVKGMTCDRVREILAEHLICLGIRMEKLPGSNWVHIDIRTPGPGGRYFTP